MPGDRADYDGRSTVAVPLDRQSGIGQGADDLFSDYGVLIPSWTARAVLQPQPSLGDNGVGGLVVEKADTDLAVPQPDPGRIARSLERLTRLLVAVDPLATASTIVVGSLQTIAGWLATLGEPILRLLPLLR